MWGVVCPVKEDYCDICEARAESEFLAVLMYEALKQLEKLQD